LAEAKAKKSETQTEVQKFFEARKKLKEITKALSPKVTSPKTKKTREPIKITIGASLVGNGGKKRVEVTEKDSDDDDFGPALPPMAESTPAGKKKLRNMEADMDMFATDEKCDDPFSSFGASLTDSPKLKKIVEVPEKVPSPVPRPVLKPISDFAELTRGASSPSSSSSSSSSDSSSDSSSSNEEPVVQSKVESDSKLSKTQEFSFLDDEEDSGEDNYDPANCIHSDSDEKSTLLTNVTLPTPLTTITGLDETKSGSSIVMSPVTPPTPDEDKTLVIDEPPEPQTEPKLKPQAVVQPMNSDTSPLSSEEPSQRNQHINDQSPAMQSVLQTLQPRSTAQSPPPLLAALTGQAPLTASLLNVVRNINPEPNVVESQAAMVLRNLAEIGKLLPAAPLETLVAQTTGSHDEAGTPPDSPSPRPRRSKSRKRTKAQIEQSASSSRHHRQTFKKRKEFQRAVVKTAKESIKPFFKARRIDKHQYKKIMRDLVRKVVNTSKTYTLDADKVARLVEKYVNRYNDKPSDRKKKKEEMLGFFNEKKLRPESPESPSDTSITDIIESVTNSSSTRRGVLTIPELPLPPPPPKQPPPRQFGATTGGTRHY